MMLFDRRSDVSCLSDDRCVHSVPNCLVSRHIPDIDILLKYCSANNSLRNVTVFLHKLGRKTTRLAFRYPRYEQKLERLLYERISVFAAQNCVTNSNFSNILQNVLPNAVQYSSQLVIAPLIT